MDDALVKAQEALALANEAKFIANNMWLLVATVLVFIMHLGFATLEAGFVQKKNVVNILFKNGMIIAIGLLTYYFIGFNLMYPGANEGGFFGFAGFGLLPLIPIGRILFSKQCLQQPVAPLFQEPLQNVSNSFPF